MESRIAAWKKALASSDAYTLADLEELESPATTGLLFPPPRWFSLVDSGFFAVVRAALVVLRMRVARAEVFAAGS